LNSVVLATAANDLMMNVLLLGSGGREHAIALALARSPLLKTLFVAAGNPGMAEIGENVTRRKSPT
jgi:phosphoribosylamine-glycine ligase